MSLRLLVQAGSLLLVARLLGPQQFGMFAGLAALAVLLGTLSTFGTHLVLLSEMSKDPLRRMQVLPYALPTTLLCGCVLLAVFLLIGAAALSGSGIGWRVLLAIGVAELLLQPLSALAVVELLAAERTARSQLLQTLPLALRLMVAGVVFVWQPPDALEVYGYGYCLATAIALAVVLGCTRDAWPQPRQWRPPTTQELRESASFAALNITAIGPAELDKALATRLLPLVAAGVYAAGARVVGAVTLPVVALMLSALPRLFREGQYQPQRAEHLLRWIFAATAMYGIVLALGMWWCAPLFVWLLGSQYVGVDEMIRWLCLAVPGLALRIAVGNALMALGRPWMRAGFEVVGVVVLSVAAIIMTAHWGARGMPLALACSEWVMALLGGALVIRVRR
ncbi:oligosaccharide flippase family protein [Stenotrophomonas acidaminiphila]|uniref:lipopolysaccharide biosynthesis protein n=1 Tax=Stenotrophomonas acidaminiphila TaxID=128780 RepID=UPI0028B11156|nr:oligosaccharide flippase family protein [Stenotrophomonas acidaminiphila]